MEKYIMPNSSEKKKIVKAFALEATLLVTVVAVLVLILNYLKIIDLSSIFALKSEETVSTSNIEKPKQTQSVRATGFIKANEALSIMQKNKAVRYSYNSTEFEAEIYDVNLKGGVLNGNILYKYAIIFKVGGQNDLLTYHYTEKTVPKVKISSKKEDKIEFKDLKTGDKVVVRQNFSNLRTYPDSLNEATIVLQ